MALEGYASFVIEGDKGKEIYDLFMNLKAKCSDEKEIELATLGIYSYHMFNERNCHNAELISVTISKDEEYLGASYISDIEFSEGILRISSYWRRIPALLCYFKDSGLKDYEGYFYHESSEADIIGTTNDTEGKYFKLAIEYAPEEYIVPEGETALGNFCYWDTMKKLHIPASVTEIEYIYDTYELSEIVIDKQNPKYDSRNNCNAIIETADNRLILGCMNTIIPDDITEIGDRAFRDCKHLSKIIIPDSVQAIGDLAFYGCCDLTHVTLPQNLKTLKKTSFNGCENLSYIKIPKSVECIEAYVFGYCKSLTDIHYEGTVEQWHKISKGEDWKEYTPTISVHCSDGIVSETEKLYIQDSVTEIDEMDFTHSPYLSEIVVDEQNPKYDSRNNCNAIIETATNRLILGCMNTIIPDGVREIGDSAFRRRAFNDCENFSSIKIPKSVESIETWVFGYCKSLTDIYYEGTVEQWHKISKWKGWNDDTPAISVHCSDGVVEIESKNKIEN